MPAPRPLLAATLLAAGVTLAPARAGADDAGAPSASDEIAALEADLSRAALQLSSGCAVACPALASMERAAARICTLDPGPRCADARAKVKEAARKVRLSCECKPEEMRSKAHEPANREEPSPKETPPVAPGVVAEAAPPPPPAPAEAMSSTRRGGCAACTMASDDRDATGAGLLTVLGVVGEMLRRRSRSPRRRSQR